ncbi:MAG: GTPase HflX [Lachnospiraceae bacterium]|nr:GTPase HflX [Lachnospiraceae bacterium]
MNTEDTRTTQNEEIWQNAILVGLQTDQKDDAFERMMEELEQLAEACHIYTIAVFTQRAKNPVHATYIGSGKVAEVAQAVQESEAAYVIFDQTLSPMQFRNLNEALGVEVMDRTGLILRIFAEQARTREARLQVEHAHLQYIMPRLAGMWTHLGRQAGSSGSMSNRGIGETQLELDRRHIERRMAELEKELKVIARERTTQREKRLKAGIPRVSLVGYTNAGKSTIMNRLLALNENPVEDKKVLEQDKLFATLDTTVRKIQPKGERPILLSDTVGFIDELPHSLVKAFRSTLEEVKYADLLLQVIDYSDSDYRACMKVTEETLREIGAAGIPMICIFNKTDLVHNLEFEIPAVRNDNIYISAGNEIGIAALWQLIMQKLREGKQECTFMIPYDKGNVLHRLQETAEVLSTDYRAEGTLVKVRCNDEVKNRYACFACDTLQH